MFTCPVAWFFFSFIQEALGPAWQAKDLGDFLETGPERGDAFWFMFAALAWTLWSTRNKMVIEKIFLCQASDSVFKMLAFLQLWYTLYRQWYRERVDGMLRALQDAACHLTPSCRRASPCFGTCLPFFVSVGHVCVVSLVLSFSRFVT
jgi:hypothetical protein